MTYVDWEDASIVGVAIYSTTNPEQVTSVVEIDEFYDDYGYPTDPDFDLANPIAALYAGSRITPTKES